MIKAVRNYDCKNVGVMFYMIKSRFSLELEGEDIEEFKKELEKPSKYF